MDIVAWVLVGIVIYFVIVLCTLWLGALGKKDEREILRRNAEDLASREGGMTLPPQEVRRGV